MEQYLQAFVSYQQDDWVSWLSLAEFTGNNTMSETMNMTLFFANKGFYPHMGFEPLATPTEPQALKVDEWANHMQELQKDLQEAMLFAQARHAANTDASHQPAPVYQVGDKVWLLSQNIQTQHPSKKLDWKWLEQFKILKVVSPYTYKLELPLTIKVHSVFYIFLLDSIATDLLSGHI